MFDARPLSLALFILRSATRSHFTYDCNPHVCLCGYYGDAERACTCSPAAITRYQKRTAGPLLDRIDIYCEVPRVQYEKLSGDRQGEGARAPGRALQLGRARVVKARPPGMFMPRS